MGGHLVSALQEHGVERYFFASSACVYAADKQSKPDVRGLSEADAYPAMPEDGYGWETVRRADVSPFPRGSRARSTNCALS
jgi:hypothetical protein